MSDTPKDDRPKLLGCPIVRTTPLDAAAGDIAFGPLRGFPYTRPEVVPLPPGVSVRIVPPEPTPPVAFNPRAGLMGGATLTTDNAHEIADPACETCGGSGLCCPEDAESLTGSFEASGLDAGAGRLCACCGCDRADHTYCPLCILKTREQFDTANQ